MEAISKTEGIHAEISGRQTIGLWNGRVEVVGIQVMGGGRRPIIQGGEDNAAGLSEAWQMIGAWQNR